MRNTLRLLLVSTLLLGCVGCDQATKEIARAQIALGATHSFLGDTFRLTHVENIGAFLGLGANLPETARVLIFQVGIALLVLALLWAAALRKGTRPSHVAGFALLAASGIGNLIDRFINDGRVTDFLNIGIGGLRTGIFNIADVVGMIGFAVLILAKGETRPREESLDGARGE